MAAPLNVTVWLRALGWAPDGSLWPAAVVLLVAAVGGWLLRRTGDVAAALVFGWAFAAIGAANGGRPVLPAALAVGGVTFAVAVVAGARRTGPFPTRNAVSA